jgi:ketosteroid isomerase-like protein
MKKEVPVMRKKWAPILATALSVGLSASVALGDDVADLKAAHAQALKALAAGDVDLWLASFHDEHVRFDRNSQQPTDYKGVDKAALRKSLASSFASTERYSITPVDLQYRVIGDTGIVWGYHVDAYKDKGSPGTVTISRVSAVYARSGGKWLRVCTHVSAVPPGN